MESQIIVLGTELKEIVKGMILSNSDLMHKLKVLELEKIS